MVRGHCPSCEELVEITPTGEHQHPTRGTSKWWRVVMHKHPSEPRICDGSGKKI